MENNSQISAGGNSEDCEVVIVEEENEELEEEEDEMGLYLKAGEYNVEKFLDMKIEKGKKMFLVKWQGYPYTQATWEPIEHLDAIPTMVEAFEKEYQKKNQPRTQEPQAKKTISTHPSEPKTLKRFATANLTNETITKKIKGNPNNETGEEEYHAEESSPAGDQSPIVEIDEDEEEKIETKSTSPKPNQRKVPKPPLKAPQRKVQAQKKKEKIGSFKQKDKPLCIKGVKPGKNNEFYFIVEWEKRSDGTKPENSHVSNEEFKLHAPKFLFEFYESKLVIFSRKKPQNGQKEPQIINEQSPVQNTVENEETKENVESRGAFDNPLDSKKFSDKNNHQILEEMRRELDSKPINEDDDDDDDAFDSSNKLNQNNFL